MAACSVKLLSLIIFIHVLRETTAPPRNDAERETQHSITNAITMENSTHLSNISNENSSGPDIISMKNFTDPCGLTMENFSGPNNISLVNFIDPNDVAMSTDLANSTDLVATAMSNSTDPNNMSIDNFIDFNDITLSNSTVPKTISMENSTDPNDVTIEHFTDLNDITTGSSSDPNDITMANYTNMNDTTMDNSINLNDKCSLKYGFTPSNRTTDIELLVRRLKGFGKCLNHKYQKLVFSKLHNSTQRWNQSHNNLDIDNLKNTKAAVSVWLYGSPILIVAGTIGNILSFAEMLRKKIRQSTTSLYLSVLAIVDTAVLYTGLFNGYIIVSGYDILGSSQYACKFFYFILHGLQQFDSWILVSVALERVCAVFLPHKVKEIFIKRFATFTLIIQVLVIIAINNHFFYTRDLVYTGRDSKHQLVCGVAGTHKVVWFVLNIYPWIDFCLLSLVPFAIIISSNVAIVCRLLCSRYKRQRLQVNTQVKMTSMTAILITVSIVFLVTTAPLSIYLIQEWDLNHEASVYQKATLKLVKAILNMINYFNYTVNFLLYCVSGTHFRKELKAMFSWKKRINPIKTGNAPHAGNTTTTTL